MGIWKESGWWKLGDGFKKDGLVSCVECCWEVYLDSRLLNIWMKGNVIRFFGGYKWV